MGTPRKRSWLLVAVGAGCVLIAAVALLVVLQGGGAKADATATPAPKPIAPASPSEGTAATPAIHAPAPRGEPAAEPDPTAPTNVVVSDDGLVRDHRANPGGFTAPPPTKVPSPPVFVGREFAGSVGAQVTPLAQQCASQIPADARGTRPVIQVEMTVSIKDGKMTIDDIDTKFRDVTGDQPAVKDCVKQKVAAIAVDASGQPDVDHYAITMPMRVPS